MSRRVVAAASAAMLAGCTVGPNFEAPSLFSPASWFGAGRPVPAPVLPVAEPVDPAWWALFGDPVLTGLAGRVAGANLDVRTAGARLGQSRAQRRIAGADETPGVNANASYTRQRQSEQGVASLFSGGGNPQTQSNGLGGREGGVPVSGIGGGAGSGGASPFARPFDLFQGGFDASWELDLWGRVRRQIESADAAVEASEEARRGTLVATLAEVGRNYLQLRGVQSLLFISRANLGATREAASITVERASGGLATDLDVANARAEVASVAAGIPSLEQREAELVNALSLLLGMTPGGLRAELAEARPVPPPPPRVPVGLPSELARRRPDIRQAEAQLHAATADIGAAEADFFPRLTLSGSFALQALQLRDLGSWSARTYGLGPSLTIPIFEGGRLRATLNLREAQQQEAAINYQRTVLGALHEVDNALTALAAEQRRREQLARQVAEARRARRLAQDLYRQGISDFLQVLTTQRTVLAAEQQLADSTTAISTNLVALYKALGGGWEIAYPLRPAGGQGSPAAARGM